MDSKLKMFNKALKIAYDAHEGQVDKAGKDYILHPLRVCLDVKGCEQKIIAILHDVVENSHYTLAELSSYFTREIIDALDALAKRPGEFFEDYIIRVSQNNLASQVKIIDLYDNINISRLPEVIDVDLVRNQKYKNALNTLINTTAVRLVS